MTLVHATNSPTMKGYFGIGVEGISKAVNVGTLFRTAHAFGASFVFTVRAQHNRREGGQDLTSDPPRSVPPHHFAGLEDFRLPLGCRRAGWGRPVHGRNLRGSGHRSTATILREPH